VIRFGQNQNLTSPKTSAFLRLWIRSFIKFSVMNHWSMVKRCAKCSWLASKKREKWIIILWVSL